MVLVLFASALAQEPAAPVTVPVHLELRAPGGAVAVVDERRVGFHVERSLRPLCDAPCDVQLPAEPVLLRFSAPGHNPAEARVKLAPGRGATVRGRLGSSGLMGLGIGLGAAGSLFYLGAQITQVVNITDMIVRRSFDPAYGDLVLAGQIAALSGWTVGSILMVSSSSRVVVHPAPVTTSFWVAPTAAGVAGTF